MELKNKTILQLQKESIETSEQYKYQIAKFEDKIEEMKEIFTEELLSKNSELSYMEKGLDQKDDMQVSKITSVHLTIGIFSERIRKVQTTVQGKGTRK